jgi:threonine/homoserine/homoserine lactone efflux protein
MLTPYTTGLALAFGAYLLGMVTPGPNILAIIGTSMATGRRAGAAMALGVATGSFAWACLTLFGLATAVALYAELLTAIKLAGAAYLLWMAFKAFRSAASAEDLSLRAVRGEGDFRAWYRRGLVIQMTNAKAALWWIAIMSLAMQDHAPLLVGGIVVAGTAAISVAGHLAYAVAFSTAPMVAGYRRARRWIEATLGAYFAFASYKVLTWRSE